MTELVCRPSPPSDTLLDELRTSWAHRWMDLALDHPITSLWPILLKPSLFRQATALLAGRINQMCEELNVEFDYVCGVPASGTPLAAGVGVMLDKGIVILPKDHFMILRWKKESQRQLINKRILLVDSVVKSGFSASVAWECLSDVKASPVAIASIIHDDTFAEDSVTNFIRGETDRELYWHVLKMSDLRSSFEALKSADELATNDY